jgi:hypothetical protein
MMPVKAAGLTITRIQGTANDDRYYAKADFGEPVLNLFSAARAKTLFI